jgi:hypothetical protein
MNLNLVQNLARCSVYRTQKYHPHGVELSCFSLTAARRLCVRACGPRSGQVRSMVTRCPGHKSLQLYSERTVRRARGPRQLLQQASDVTRHRITRA